MSDLTGVLTQIRRGINRNAYPNEAAVRTQIVQRILHELGWNVFDPDKVCNEFSLRLEKKTRRIDLALCVSNRNPRCIIELKSTDYDLRQIGRSDGDKQLFQYAFHAGAPVALLTNGNSWRFYSTYGAGTYAERLVRALDIETQPLEEIAAVLDRYLSYANTESGKAAHYAVEDLHDRIGRYKARQAIPHAWSRLVGDDPDERIVALLTEATSLRVESAPAQQDVVEFLRCLKPDDGSSIRKSKQSRKSASKKPIAAAFEPGPPVQNPAPPVEPHRTIRPDDGGSVRYYLLGEQRTAKNARAAYVAIFKDLAEREPDFPSRVEPKLRGRKNRGVARTKQGLASKESVVRSAASLPGSWYLLTHMSNKQKIHSLRIACSTAGIPFGDRSGLEIDLPNA